MRHPYADFIEQVAKPARYLGGEYLSAKKDPKEVSASMVLAFPDVYEIGMSHMGTKILYKILNGQPDILAERAFTPWIDMEKELRDRRLPLLSLETARPLSAFDVVGVSLQYELTFTNVLTMLDLGGIPLRAEDRSLDMPLVIGGGPCATHPEPMAPFFDAFWIGDAEEELPGLVRDWQTLRSEQGDRREALAVLAARYPIYVPALYETACDPDTQMEVVGRPLRPDVPARVRRGFVADLDKYPFPGDAPVPYAEAVFDRAGVEIARGCTEGCRFCQAGMIYRPVRERSPESVVESVMTGVEKAGYDETSLTSLSTADYSCITPLVKNVMAKLRHKKVSLSVSSLRAYGLNEDILDEMQSSRISGLTFAPEAGTQRMRDVVNKNITEAHVEESARRVFDRGMNRLKLYFMIGLPTEEEEDVLGIIETGERMLKVGKDRMGGRAQVTVSVSSHVPKPHTPFQWCAQDAIGDIAQKQRKLRGAIRSRALRLKVHDRGVSWVEGVMSRGDRRLADAIQLAWERGARFDGWEELFDLERWQQVFADSEVDVDAYLGTRPVTARLPWDHIDVGLEDGFLLSEYKKALKNRLSPPCGKVRGQLVHHTNLEDANADDRKLVCYDCGVACDLSNMRSERKTFLRTLGAEAPVPRPLGPVRKLDPKGAKKPVVAFPDRPKRRFRIRFAKVRNSAYLGHLDTTRMLARMFRRSDVEVAYTRGFHPQPEMSFAPALPLGVPALGEFFDVSIETALSAHELGERLHETAPEGIWITGVWPVLEGMPKLSKLIRTYDLGALPAAGGAEPEYLQALVDAFLAKDSVLVDRKGKPVDVRPLVEAMEVVSGAAARQVIGLLEWPSSPAFIRARVASGNTGSAKPREVAQALGLPLAPDAPLLARLGFASVVKDADDGVVAARAKELFSGQ